MTATPAPLRELLLPLGLAATLALLGVLTREPWLPGREYAMFYGPVLLLPVLAVGAALVRLRGPGIRTGAALGAGLAAAWANHFLLDPAMNEDANMSLGLYVFGGFVLLLLPAALLGVGVGWLFDRSRGVAPAPAAAPPAPLPPLGRWLLPLWGLLPGVLLVLVLEQAALRAASPPAELRAALDPGLLRLMPWLLALGTLQRAVWLLLLAVPALLLLRGQVPRVGAHRPWGTAWGVCLGLGLGLAAYSAPMLGVGRGLALLFPVLPLLGAGLGWAIGGRLDRTPPSGAN